MRASSSTTSTMTGRSVEEPEHTISMKPGTRPETGHTANHGRPRESPFTEEQEKSLVQRAALMSPLGAAVALADEDTHERSFTPELFSHATLSPSEEPMPPRSR